MPSDTPRSRRQYLVDGMLLASQTPRWLARSRSIGVLTSAVATTAETRHTIERHHATRGRRSFDCGCFENILYAMYTRAYLVVHFRGLWGKCPCTGISSDAQEGSGTRDEMVLSIRTRSRYLLVRIFHVFVFFYHHFHCPA